MEKKYIRDGRAPVPEKEATSKIMSSIRAKNTKPEMNFRKALFENKLYGYRIHLKITSGHIDIAYPRLKIALFVNGCYWHRCPYCNPPFPKTHVEFWTEKFKRNVERDNRKIKELENQGWVVLVFWECKINKDLQNCVDLVRLSLQQRNQ